MRARLRLFGSETFRSLRNRNFRLFFFGQWTSQVGTWMTLVASTLLVLKLTGSGVAVGLLTACQFGPILLLGAWAGVVADRSDKRRLLLWVQLAAMTKSFAFAVLAFMPDPPIVGFYAVAVAGGIAVAFDNPARRAFVVEMVRAEDVNNAVSMNTAIMTASRIFGPALAGLVATNVGFGWCFMADGLSYIAVLAAYFRMNTAELRTPEPTPKAKGQIREGFRYARSVPELFVPLLMLAVIGTLAFNFQVVLPLFATRTLGGTDGDFTILYSILSAGSLVGALMTARRSRVTVAHVAAAAALFGLGMLGLASAPNLGVAFVMALILGTVSVGFITSSTAIVQVTADPAMRGRVLSMQSMLFIGTTPIGGPVLGAICEAFGARVGMAVGGIACLAAAGGGAIAIRRLGREDHRGGAVVDPERERLLEVELDRVGVVAPIPDGQVLTDVEDEVAAPGAQYEPAYNAGRPDD